MITIPLGRTRSTPVPGPAAGTAGTPPGPTAGTGGPQSGPFGPTAGTGGPQSGPFGPAIGTGGTDPAMLIPVSSGGRPLGAFVYTAGRFRYRPVVAADRVAAATVAVAIVAGSAVAVAAVARRRPTAIGAVTMGPGGWVSLKGLSGPAPRVVADRRRPWWARVLGARRLSR